MSFWSKLGQTALRVAPYVAAPFTGGASLLAAGTANNLANKWSDSSANKEYEKTGLAPSRKFDQIMSMGGNIAGMAGGAGAFGKGDFGSGSFTGFGSGGGTNDTANKIGGIVSGAGGIIGGIGGGGNQGNTSPQNRAGGIGPSQQAIGRMDQNNPNLAIALAQGRREALRGRNVGIGPTKDTVTEPPPQYNYIPRPRKRTRIPESVEAVQ